MAAAKENKVEFGLRNCYYAVVTVDEGGKITYGAPKKLPGAVSITFDKSGDLIRFKADDVRISGRCQGNKTPLLLLLCK